jgi:choline-glycine betaine transporter
MTVFGNSTIYLIMNQGPQTSPVPLSDVALALFYPEAFPFSAVLSFIAMAILIILRLSRLLIQAMVVDSLASGGVEHTVWQRIFWASLMGIVAIALHPCRRAKCVANSDNSECIAILSDLTDIYIRTFKSFAPGFDQA